jgi:hypothetical protein
MKRVRVIAIAVVAVAAILLALHLAVNTNWPGLMRSLHGK